MNHILFFILLLSGAFSFAAPMDKAKLAQPLPANIWIEMSKIIQPGVVGIYLDIDINKSKLRRDPLFDFLEEYFGHGFQFEQPDSAEKSTPIGTGFIIDKEGHIVTNNHVVEAISNPKLRTKLQVQINGETQLHNVTVVGGNSRSDIALLKLTSPVKNLQPLELGDSDDLQVGEYVAAFGNPYGHSNSMTVGIVSAKGRAIKELNRFPFIQTDASINPGNSGGPLLNTKGYVIGVNTAIDPRAQGIGFAIPSNFVKKLVDILRNGGTIQQSFLGVELAMLHPQAARSLGLKKSAVVVTRAEPGYPAAKAGIKSNDIIVDFDNAPVTSIDGLITMVQDTEVGKVVPIKVLRPLNNHFTEKQFQVKLTQFPGNGARLEKIPMMQYQGQGAPYNLGFNVVDSSSGARRYFSVPVDAPFAPIVSQVEDSSPAATSGLATGDLILEVNGTEVQSTADVMRAIKRGRNILAVKTQLTVRSISIGNE